MNRRDKERLQRNYATLLDVSYASISPHLISTFVLSLEMHDEITCLPTERKKMEKLLSTLPSRGGNAMKELIKALRPSYNWISRELEKENGNAPLNYNNNNNNVDNLPEMSISSHVREITRILQRNPRASSHWRLLAYSMALLPTTIADITREMSHSGGHEFALLSILEGWVTKVGNSGATFSKLISLLNREGMNQCGEHVMDYWVSLTIRDFPGNNIRNQPEGHCRPSRNQSPVITDV